MITLPSFAKINLGLEVLGARSDGYTEIRTIFQTIDLADTIEIEEAPERVLEVVCDDPTLPSGEDNLAGQAARLLLDELTCRPRPGARIRITKRIPPGGGLGGGSSNAAVTLFGLCRLWGASPTPGTLQRVAVALGSDVPFFLHGGTALGLGRGEEVWPLREISACEIVLAIPTFRVATAEAYARARNLLTPRGGTHTIWRFAWTGMGEPEFSWVLNELQPALPSGREIIDRLMEGFRESGAAATAMTGSGSAVYGLFPRGGAEAAREALAARFPEVVTLRTRTIGGREYRRALAIEHSPVSECWGVDKR